MHFANTENSFVFQDFVKMARDLLLEQHKVWRVPVLESVLKVYWMEQRYYCGVALMFVIYCQKIPSYKMPIVLYQLGLESASGRRSVDK